MTAGHRRGRRLITATLPPPHLAPTSSRRRSPQCTTRRRCRRHRRRQILGSTRAGCARPGTMSREPHLAVAMVRGPSVWPRTARRGATRLTGHTAWDAVRAHCWSRPASATPPGFTTARAAQPPAPPSPLPPRSRTGLRRPPRPSPRAGPPAPVMEPGRGPRQAPATQPAPTAPQCLLSARPIWRRRTEHTPTSGTPDRRRRRISQMTAESTPEPSCWYRRAPMIHAGISASWPGRWTTSI